MGSLKTQIVVGCTMHNANQLSGALRLDPRKHVTMSDDGLRGITPKDLIIHVAVGLPSAVHHAHFNSEIRYLIARGAELRFYPEPHCIHDGVVDEAEEYAALKNRRLWDERLSKEQAQQSVQTLGGG